MPTRIRQAARARACVQRGIDWAIEEPTDGTSRRLRLATLVGLLVGQLGLTFWRLGTSTWHTDELTYARAGRAYLSGDLTQNLEHPPLAKYLIGLPQLVIGDGLAVARLAPALAGVAIGVGLFLLVRVGVDFWTAALAWAGWVLLPRSVGLIDAGTHIDASRLERFSFLDVFAAAFVVLALLAGWSWVRQGRTAWALGAGLAGGLATASKLPGATVLVIVAVTALVLRPSWTTVRQTVAAAVVSVMVFALSYAPFGSRAPSALEAMVDVQLTHAEAGHPVFTGGRAHDKPPWWVFLSYQLEADGVLLTAATVAAVLGALVLGRGRFRWYLLAALVVPLVVLTISPVVIRHYRYLVLPAQVGLIAMGLVAMARRSRPWRLAAGVVAVPFVIAAATETVRIATLEPSDYRQLGEVLVDADRPDAQLVVRGFPDVLREYLPDFVLLSGPDAASGGPDAVVLDPTSTLRWPVPELEADALERGLVPVEMGRLVVYLDPDLAPP